MPLHNNHYKIKNPNKQLLSECGFRYSGVWSDNNTTVYKCNFPVYKYNDVCTLECRMLVYMDTGDIRIDVLDQASKGLYAGYYIEQQCYDEIIEIIDRNIKKMLKRIKAREVEE